MEISQYTKNLLDRNEELIAAALEGLTPEELHRQMAPDTNHVGWLVWHLSRVVDRNVAAMSGTDQIWVTDGWHAKFGREPDPEDRGAGHTPEQVAAFRAPDVETLLGYHRAVLTVTDAFLASLSAADLERQVPAVRGGGTVPLSTRLQGVVNEAIHHGGQVCYLRGLIRGNGWLAI